MDDITMAEDIRRRAIEGWRALQESREPRREIVWALVADAEGTVYVPGAQGKVYCRLFGNDDLTVRAWNRTVSPTANLRVDVEVLREEGMPDDYYVLGLSRVGYGGYEDHIMVYLPRHSRTHELRPSGAGTDVVDIYKRAFIELRANAQDTPNMTVRVSAGFYMTPEEVDYFSGETSPTFDAAPTNPGYIRYDLLFYDCDEEKLDIRKGTEATPGYALRPQPQVNEVPTAWIRLEFNNTSIQDVNIIDARIVIATMGASGLVTAHPLDPAEGVHTGSLPMWDRWGSDGEMDGMIWNAFTWD